MPRNSNLTAAQEVLLGAANLDENNKVTFTEWDLTIAVWLRNKNRFGCRGYEDQYPDHKRVMMEIMGNKPSSPVRRGWIKAVRPNTYQFTALGRTESNRLEALRGERNVDTAKSAQAQYDAVLPYVSHKTFRQFLADPEEPRTWLQVDAFLGLSKHNARELQDALTSVRGSQAAALTWMNEQKKDVLHRGVTGGGTAIRRTAVEALARFLEVLEKRYFSHFEAIRSKK